MLTVAVFGGPKELQEHYQARKKDAQSTLSKLPFLSKFVNKFDTVETSTQPENVIFWSCAWAHKGFGEGPDIQCLKEVTQLESFLKLGADCWNLDSLSEKFCSTNVEHTLAGLSELTVLGCLATKLGPTSVEYEPKLQFGKHSDIKVNFEKRTVFFEVTAMNKRVTEQKLESIFHKVAEWIWSQLEDDLLVRIEVDTGKLRFNEKGIDVDKSAQRILDFLKTTKLLSIFVGNFMLDFGWGVRGLDPTKSLYDQKLMVQFYLHELYQRIEEEPFLTFAKITSPALFDKCPVSSFWCYPAKYRAIEVADREVSPSPIAWIERNAFLSHMCRKLKEEMEQLEPEAINVVVLKAVNWSVSGYETGKILADYEFDIIKRHIEGFLRANIFPDLSAIAVYEGNFRSSRFVLNPAAAANVQIPLEFLERLIR